jgi:hypothetical protein
MTLKLSNIRRIIILLCVVWFAGYASATTICANTCPDCMSVSLNSCSASCSAVTVPSHAVVKVKCPKAVLESAELPLIYVSVQIANIWKPPKHAVPSSFQLIV